MKKYIVAVILLTTFLSSCEKAFLEPSPNGENTVVFDEFWNLFNEKYAMFEVKNVDWKAVYDTKKALVTETTTKEELFEIMSDMVLLLKDGHTEIEDTERDLVRSYDILNGAPINTDLEILIAHLNTIKTEDFQTFMQDNSVYTLLDGNIGYIQIPTFDVELTEEEINTMLTHFKDTKGLIIDVRDNTGGDPAGAALLASHLTDKEESTGLERFKTGPGQADFSDSPAFNKPSGGTRYTKPIKVLTNGLCFSATTTFIYQTNPSSHVTFIGSRTGGGSGSVADGLLSNGWKYALSTSEFIDYEGRHLDNGFDPDIEVWLDENTTDIDEVLQKAIDEL